MFDTHCHLNFKAFKKNLGEVINRAKKAGVQKILIPGTDLKTSKKAIEIAGKYNNVYAAVGIHPHHVYQIKSQNANLKSQNFFKDIENLLENKTVVAVGEVGIDKHLYQTTKYENYQVDEAVINLQKELFIRQVKLAIKYNKSLIIHNREAVEIVLDILKEHWDKKLEGRTVFHCCEPQDKLLDFAKKHKIYIGVDGDITYNQEKQRFIKKIPLELLVFETDSPFLLPEPLRSQKKYPNQPKNLPIIAEFIAELFDLEKEKLISATSENGKNLFNL